MVAKGRKNFDIRERKKCTLRCVVTKKRERKKELQC
jgi:hypothetical protein